jgi:hypothetical protein
MLLIAFWLKLILSLAAAGAGIGLYALYLENRKKR